ncbi:MAG: hypothetical protein WBV40_03335 [Candidatus Cybelea sp.]
MSDTERPDKYTRLRKVLLEMHQLLVKHDAGQQESTLQALRSIDTADQNAIAKSLNTSGFWGGAGSIFDLILFESPWTPEFRRDVPDDDKLRLLELDLIDEMVKLGIADTLAIARKSAIRGTA